MRKDRRLRTCFAFCALVTLGALDLAAQFGGKRIRIGGWRRLRRALVPFQLVPPKGRRLWAEKLSVRQANVLRRE